MKTLKEFIIPYLGIAEGSHQYTFEIDKDFFRHFEKSKIQEGSIEVAVNFIKQGRMVILEISGQGHFKAECDRCMSEIDVPIDIEDKVILKLTGERAVKNEEVVYLDSNTSHIDLSPFIYESIHLHLPFKNVRSCEEEAFKFCDQSALENLGKRQESSSEVRESPWKALMNLNFKEDK